MGKMGNKRTLENQMQHRIGVHTTSPLSPAFLIFNLLGYHNLYDKSRGIFHFAIYICILLCHKLSCMPVWP